MVFHCLLWFVQSWWTYPRWALHKRSKCAHGNQQKQTTLCPLLFKNQQEKNLPQNIKIKALLEKLTQHDTNNKKLQSGLSNDTRIFCPFKASHEYIAIRSNYTNTNDPFFVNSDASALRPTQIRKVLKNTIKSLNLNPTLYDTHSLRIRYCCDLLKYGMPVDWIKLIGHWKSNAIFRYIRQ